MELISHSTQTAINNQVMVLQQNQNFEKLLCQLSGITELPVSRLVVSDNDYVSYNDTVNRYSDQKNVVTNITKFIGCAITLCQTNDHGQQIDIIVKDFVFIGLQNYIAYKLGIVGEISESTTSLANIFFHELGHAIDYFFLLNTFNYIVDNQHEFDLHVESEKYHTQQAMALFSEYFAQVFADKIVPCSQRFDEETICTQIDSIRTTTNIVEHAQQTAYLFSFLAAFFHAKGEEICYENFGMNEKLVSAISNFCSELKARLIDISKPEFKFSQRNTELAICYKDIIMAEYEENQHFRKVLR